MDREKEVFRSHSVRSARFADRKTLSQITTQERHRGCGRWFIPKQHVTLRLKHEPSTRAHFAGVQLCGRIWSCPVCSPRIRQARAVDADASATTSLELYGSGTVLLLTLTLPHDAGERLAEVLGATRRAFSALVAGRAWQEDKKAYGLAHYIRAHDVTVGPNGWHPHIHILLFAHRALPDAALEALRLRLFDRWAHSVETLDRRAPSYQHGVTLEAARNRNDVARYICQVVTGPEGSSSWGVAMELARTDLKVSQHPGHRTPWQVLADFGDRHSLRDRALWQEYERATKGVKAIRWSNGLRKAVRLDAELTDEQIVMEEIGGEVVHTFGREEWRHVRDARGFYSVSATSELLEMAELDGAAAVRNYLAKLHQRDALDLSERSVYRIANLGHRNRAPKRQRKPVGSGCL